MGDVVSLWCLAQDWTAADRVENIVGGALSPPPHQNPVSPLAEEWHPAPLQTALSSLVRWHLEQQR